MSEELNGQKDYAFPFEIPAGGGCGPAVHFGMTLRDYFAAKAMQGLMGRNWEEQLKRDGENAVVETWAKSAYEIADAMLAARVK